MKFLEIFSGLGHENKGLDFFKSSNNELQLIFCNVLLTAHVMPVKLHFFFCLRFRIVLIACLNCLPNAQ